MTDDMIEVSIPPTMTGLGVLGTAGSLGDKLVHGTVFDKDAHLIRYPDGTTKRWRTRIGRNHNYIVAWPPGLTPSRVYRLWKRARKQAEQHGQSMNAIMQRVVNDYGGRVYAFIVDASWWSYDVRNYDGVLTYSRNRVKDQSEVKGSGGVGLELFQAEKRAMSLWRRVGKAQIALRSIIEEKAREAALPELSEWVRHTNVVVTMGTDVFIVLAEFVGPGIVRCDLFKFPDETVHCKIDLEHA